MKELQEELEAKIKDAETLFRSSEIEEEFRGVEGLNKLRKRIRQEIKFLEKFVQDPSRLKKEHLSCSNLTPLGAIISVARGLDPRPLALLRTFPFQDRRNGLKTKLTVDIVSHDGLCWIKVIARNPKALDLNSCGSRRQFGQKSILDQAKDFLECARNNPVLFESPKVVFVFRSGISSNLAERLELLGIEVRGEIKNLEYLADSDSENDDDDAENDATEGETEKNPENDKSECLLNLDITAMIAYVSALTNGSSNYEFKEKILTEQAARERARPVKPVLDALFQNKKLIACRSAINGFEAIIRTLAGPGERARAEDLIKRIETVVEDEISERMAALELSGKIKERPVIIFGTGDRLRIPTVSANSGFVRACRGRGLPLAVILHESRALTEGKMKTAEPLTT